MKQRQLQVIEIALFAMLGALMFLTKYLMQALPNIHLTAMFLAAYTITYRWRALIPLYVYVLIDGVAGGFATWWLPYLYIWLPVWGAVMVCAPAMERRGVSAKKRAAAYMALCALHGLAFGAMYAPAQALLYGMSGKALLAWIAAGLWFDVLHAAGNFAAGALVLPLAGLLRRLKTVF